MARFLLKKNYIVHGVKRKSSSLNTDRIDSIFEEVHKRKNFFLHYGDLSDSLSVLKNIQEILPDEIYNLGAQSHVKVSFNLPEYTTNINALGTLRILDSLKILCIKKKIKFYQAGSSEMFGSSSPPQNEKTNFIPQSPYAISKLYAHWITVNYREAYNIFACNGILFNHESFLRGETFVTKKIVKSLCSMLKNDNEKLYLGNLYAKRDWGHAEDYVEAMWRILQQKKPDDYVIATGKQYSVKQFLHLVAKKLNLRIVWRGKGLKEKGYINAKPKIFIDKNYFRPTEVETLLGDYSKAKNKLNWKPKHDIFTLVADMVSKELNKNIKLK